MEQGGRGISEVQIMQYLEDMVKCLDFIDK